MPSHGWSNLYFKDNTFGDPFLVKDLHAASTEILDTANNHRLTSTESVTTRGGLMYLNAEEIARMDNAAIDEFGMDAASLMEKAGMATAAVARHILGGKPANEKVCCIVGKGNNGGDGLVAARHLSNWGAEVTVILAQEKKDLHETPARQLAVVERIGIDVRDGDSEFASGLIVDALLGYGAKGNPRGQVASLIRRANESQIPVLAVDIPSGLDATTGTPNEPCMRATATVTFGLPKTGFLNPLAREFVGELYLADISIPRKLYERFGQKGDIFRDGTLVKVW